ncbi:MAG: hypothetical protein GXO93_08485 [FCB group bacterium]|nr:hypothetical protein [FCB group bacterium]
MTLVTILSITHYLPVLTTFFSVYFSYVIISRYKTKPQAIYLLWWGIGVAVYGMGTFVEAYTTLFGWREIIFKLWYIFGALLGGAPLAIGSIYLLLKRRAGNMAVFLLLVTVSITSVFVILSPVNYQLVDPTILNSKVLVWQSIRKVSPFINGLAGLFLIGGAIYSAFTLRKKPKMKNRLIGNIFIALGALLPGIGGTFSRLGYTEALYVGELAGIILIWYGYIYCQKPARIFIPAASEH